MSMYAALTNGGTVYGAAGAPYTYFMGQIQ
jgi:hypothetical protein